MIRFAFILAALLSFDIATAGTLDDTPANHLRFTFHSVASTWTFDPDWDIYSARIACTDEILLKLSRHGWDVLAAQLEVKTFFDAEALRPDIRVIFRHNCGNGTSS